MTKLLNKNTNSDYILSKNSHKTEPNSTRRKMGLEMQIYMSSLLALFEWQNEKKSENED